MMAFWGHVCFAPRNGHRQLNLPGPKPAQERKHSQPLRKAAARSAETICVTIGEILRAFAPTECANYFRNSGYAQS
jgi:hypothetical protein